MRSSRTLPVLLAALLPLACSDSGANPLRPTLDAEVAAAPTGPVLEGTVGRLTGGGHVRAGPWRVSFGGMVEGAEGDEVATGKTTMVVQFHRVSIHAVSGRTFKAERLNSIRFVLPGDPTRCHVAVFMSMEGSLDGDPGWELLLRADDTGPEPGRPDTIRLLLFDPGGTEVYDMTGVPGNDFPRDSWCVGQGRANLTGGNLTIHRPSEGVNQN